MAGYKISLLALMCLVSFPAFALDKAYQCVDAQKKTTLQDSPCPKDSVEKILSVSEFQKKEPSDGLRPLELTLLERYHELDVIQKYYDEDLRNQLAIARVDQKNAIEMEKLRHEQAKEMFDLNYHHFWVYGYGNGNGVFPFSYGVNSNSATQNFDLVNPESDSTSSSGM